MLDTRGWTTTLAAAGVLLLGGLGAATAQEAGEEPAGLDVEALAEQMELGQEARADLSKLDDLLRRRAAMRQGMAGLRAEMHGTVRDLRSTLTAEQFGRLHRAMRASMRMGPPGGPGTMGDGMMRGHGPRSGMRGMHGRHGPGQAMPGRGTAPRGPGAGMRAGECPYLQSEDDTEDGSS